MLCIKPSTTNPYFNIASEEYLLKNIDDEIFMLWRNEPSIIVGKHQNTLGEINHPYVHKNKIKVVRRLSGGGTVFHDLGNVNFTFIRSGDKSKLVDFKKFTQPVVEILNLMGAKAYHSGRNDLLIDGLKISGNAEHVYKDKVLHHGTLLYSSQLSQLNEAIKVDLDNYEDKSVKSFRSKVCNICDYVVKPLVVENFLEQVFEFISRSFSNTTFYELNSKDNEQINQLMIEKYQTWEWNYGYSPNYELKRKIYIDSNLIQIEMMVLKGEIKSLKLNGLSSNLKNKLESQLIGCNLNYETILLNLKEINSNSNEISNIDMINLLF